MAEGRKSNDFQKSNFDIYQDSQDQMEEEVLQCSQIQQPNKDNHADYPSQARSKRKPEEQLSLQQSKKTTLMNWKTLVMAIDPDEELSIHEFGDDVESDPIVKEYLDKILDLNFFPNIPRGKTIDLEEPEEQVEFNNECRSDVIKTIMNFLRLNYFKNNMKEASGNNVAVINLQAKVITPCFQTYPNKTHVDMARVRHSGAIQIQSLLADGAKFNAELMCLRSAHLLYTEIKRFTDDADLLRQLIQHHFEIHFYKASVEFIQKFNVKKFDWERFVTKVKAILPKWRRENSDPPQSLYNPYANDIIERIRSNREKFDTATVKQDFEQFIKDGEIAVQRMRETGKLKFPNQAK